MSGENFENGKLAMHTRALQDIIYSMFLQGMSKNDMTQVIRSIYESYDKHIDQLRINLNGTTSKGFL